MIFIVMTLSCSSPVMQNITKFPWNDYDREELKYAQKRCGEIYEDAKCVKLFRKFGKRDYSVVCGRKN